jgi:hypothetical protein
MNIKVAATTKKGGEEAMMMNCGNIFEDKRSLARMQLCLVLRVIYDSEEAN